MTPRFSLLIVDDEPSARLEARRLLDSDDEIEIVGEADSGQEAVDLIRSERPQVVVLDVQMPETDGFGVLQLLAPGMVPAVVCPMADDELLVRAFEVAAVDYVLKPFDRERFETAIRRAKTRVRTDEQEERGRKLRRLALDVEAARPTLDRILVEERHRRFFVPVEALDWLEEDGNYVVLHVGKERHYVRGTLRTLERRLPTERFARLHRSAVVNLDRIVELRPIGHGDFTVVMATGDTVALSRRFRARLPELFGRTRSTRRRS